MNHIPHFPRLLSSAATLILRSPVVVSPMAYVVDPDRKISPNFLMEQGDYYWKTVTPPQLNSVIEAGAEVNAATDSGWTPLHAAAENSTGSVVKMLLNADAKVNAKTKNGRTPLDVAEGTRPSLETINRYSRWDSKTETPYMVPGMPRYRSARYTNAIVRRLKAAGAK